jgi:hypothetical protein
MSRYGRMTFRQNLGLGSLIRKCLCVYNKMNKSSGAAFYKNSFWTFIVIIIPVFYFLYDYDLMSNV